MYMQIEPLRLGKIERLAITTTEQEVSVRGKYILLQNLDPTETVYFKEKDGVACTSSNGAAVPPLSVFPVPLSADTLSVVASGTANVALIFID